MTDFLSRLAERTLGVAPVVQPVYTPMFAPASASTAVVAQEAAWDAAGLELVETEPAPPGARAHTPRPAHHPSTAEGRFSHAEEIAPALTSPPPLWQRGEKNPSPVSLPASEDTPEGVRQRVSRMAAEEQGPPASRLPGVDTVHRKSADQEERSPAVPFRPGPALAPITSVVVPDSVPPAPQSAPPIASQRAAPVPGPARRLVTQEERSPAAPFKAGPAPVPGPVRRLVAEEFPAPQSGAEPLSLPAPQTIRVSIGRIDVRAIMPPTPPARRAPAARSGHKPSLEEYLQQRKGGSR